jgi:cytochrome oxidase Cu insertion factor (SCO1/SenC/PrrC family)
MRLPLARPCALLAVLGGLGCAPSSAPGANDVADPSSDLSVGLPLTLASGDPTDLARLRGRPVLVFLFATYDTACQLALEPLTELQARTPELQLIGIAVQPDAEAFLPPYASALDVRFTLAFDPTGNLLRGTTGLGAIPAVPFYVLLDAQGVVQDRHVGVLEKAALADFVAPVLP